MLSEAISRLHENGENHVNHCEQAETQTGEDKTLSSVTVSKCDHPSESY